MMINLIETALKKYLELWTGLNHDNPNIGKIYSDLASSQKSIEMMNDFWKKNPVLDNFNLKSKYFYGKFLSDVLECKKAGDQIIENFGRVVKKAVKKKGLIENIGIWSDLENISEPLCLIEKIEVIFFLNIF